MSIDETALEKVVIHMEPPYKGLGEELKKKLPQGLYGNLFKGLNLVSRTEFNNRYPEVNPWFSDNYSAILRDAKPAFLDAGIMLESLDEHMMGLGTSERNREHLAGWANLEGYETEITSAHLEHASAVMLVPAYHDPAKDNWFRLLKERPVFGKEYQGDLILLVNNLTAGFPHVQNMMPYAALTVNLERIGGMPAYEKTASLVSTVLRLRI